MTHFEALELWNKLQIATLIVIGHGSVLELLANCQILNNLTAVS